MEFKSAPMREINIRTTANEGFIVNVGCANFAYTSKNKMIEDLTEYIRDPQAVEKEYNKHHKAYDEECAPERPSVAGSGITARDDLPFEEVPEPQETEGQSEATDPAADIESSGY